MPALGRRWGKAVQSQQARRRGGPCSLSASLSRRCRFYPQLAFNLGRSSSEWDLWEPGFSHVLGVLGARCPRAARSWVLPLKECTSAGTDHPPTPPPDGGQGGYPPAINILAIHPAMRARMITPPRPQPSSINITDI